MNAPSPPPIDTAELDTTLSNRCQSTQLAVPECSCQTCITQLMQAYAPELLASEAQPALS